MVKRIIAIVLMVSMMFSTRGIMLFADSIDDYAETNIITSSSEEEEVVTKETVVEETVTEETVAKETSDTLDESSSFDEKTILSDDGSDEYKEETSETTTIQSIVETVSSSDESETSDVVTENVETQEEVSETIETEISDTSDEIIISSDSEIIEDEEIVKEDIATTSEISNTENEDEELFDIATDSEVKQDTLFGETENVASESEVPKEYRYKEINDEHLTYIDDDYVAPEVDETIDSGLYTTSPLPTRYDAREYTNATTGLNYVPPIRCQNPYGICWAFSTIGMIETSIRKKGLVNNESSSNLSELALAYFGYHLKDTTNSSDYDNLGGIAGNDYHAINISHYSNPAKAVWYDCGGNQVNSTKMMSAYLGAVIEDSITEFSNDGTKTPAMISAETSGLPSDYAYKKNAFVTNNIRYINKNNKNAIKQAIMDNGSVGFAYFSEPSVKDSEGYWADSPAFHWEGSGADKKSYYFSNARTDSNHAIMIIGWDDDIDAKKFYYGGAQPTHDASYTYYKAPTDAEWTSATRKATHNGAWLCRNSWDTDPPYLADGYFYISYDETSLSDTFYSIDAIKADTYKYNYHYDSTGASDCVAPYADETQYANIFKVSGTEDQVLEAVNVGVNSTNATYDIKIYTKATAMSNPSDGTLASTKRCSNELAGFYTFELDTKVSLAKDTYFSIVIEPVSCDGDTLFVFMDYLDDGHAGYYYTYNEAELGQSYFKHKDDTADYWCDINVNNPAYAGAFYSIRTIDGKLYGNNWRIKALTNPATGITFNANGGVGSMAFQKVSTGTTTPISKCTFKKDGYRFSHWVDNLGNEYDDEADITLTGSVTLTAEWEENIYNFNGQWYNNTASGMEAKDVTSIKILMYPDTLPTGLDASYEAVNSAGGISPRGKGLTIARKGTEVYIYAPDKTASGKIQVNALPYGLFAGGTEDTDWDNGIFAKCEKIEGLDLLDMSTATTMHRMFAGFGRDLICDTAVLPMFVLSSSPKAVEIDLSSFDTSNVRAMSYTFERSAIRNINISTLNTHSLENTDFMFSESAYLQSIDLNGFRTATVSSAKGMFTCCESLESINFGNATFENTRDMSYMFSSCPNIETLDLRSFSTLNATSVTSMFSDCPRLEKIIVNEDKFKLDGVNRTNPELVNYGIFDGSTALTGQNGTTIASLEASGVSSSDAIGITYARIDKAGAPGFFTEAPAKEYTLPTNWFNAASAGISKSLVTRITLSLYPDAVPAGTSWNIPSSNGLVGYTDGAEITIYGPEKGAIYAPADSSYLFSSSTSGGGYFNNVHEIINLNKLDTSRVTNMKGMFESCNSLASANLSNFDTSHVENMSSLFSNCSSLTSVDISNFNTANVTNMSKMFYECTMLNTILVSDSFVTTNLTGSSSDLQMFTGCTHLVGGNDTAYNSSIVNKTYAKIDGKNNTAGYFSGKNMLAVTFDYDGKGTNHVEVFTKGNAVTEPTSPIALGYTFSHWYKEGTSDTVAYNFANVLPVDNTRKMKLIVKWVPVEYTINYDAGADATVSPTSFNKTYGTEITADLAVPTKLGHTFVNWYTDSTFGTVYDKTRDDIYVAGTSTYTIYAKFTANEYTVNYNLGGVGATAPTSVITKKFDEPLATGVLKNPTNIPTGYAFAGWYKESTYATPWIGDDDLTDGTDAQTIYARWKATITYSANGHGTAPEAVAAFLNDSITLPSLTNVTGYTFDTTDSWYDDSDITTATRIGKAGDSYTVVAPKTLYAKWKAHMYTVDYVLGTEASSAGAAAPTSTITKTFDKDLTAGELANPSVIPSGYEFMGWYKESTLEHEWTGDEDLTSDDGVTVYIYAKWKRAVVFSVLYNGNDIHASVPASKEITGPTDITLPSTTATGYVFGGWYRSDSDFSDTNRAGGVSDTVNVAVPTTFYAKWTPITYKIYYKNIDDSSITDGEYVDKTYDVTVTLNTTPTKTGYDFDGWYKDNTTFSDPYDGTSDLSTSNGVDKDIYAKWNPHKYNINYELSGHATSMTAKEKTYDVPYTVPTPTGIVAGYKFDGWFKEATYTTPYTGDDLTDGTDAQTIYARWKATVTYDANGHGTNPSSVDVVLGERTNLPSIANVTGYTFDLVNSWYDGSDIVAATLIGSAGAEYTVSEPKKLYAKWNENEHTITYNRDGGDWASTYDPVTEGVTNRKYTAEKILPTAINITKTGYTFLGWYKDGDTTKTVITKINANTDADVTVVAKWLENTYNIILNRNGGSFVTGYEIPSTRKYTEAKTLPTNDNIKNTGYRLEGWHEQENFSDTAVTDVLANTASHKTFYAKWVPENYTVTLHTDGGTINSGDVTGYTYGTGATLPTNVTKANSVFKGWWTLDGTNGNWGVQVTEISTTDTENKEYYARWAESFTVSFNLTTGTAPAESEITHKPDAQNVESGSPAVKPTVNPQASNFEFVGWYDSTLTTEYNFTTPITANTTIYAKWNNVSTCEVLFNLVSGTIHPSATSDITNVPEKQYVVVGGTITPPAVPTATGYKFVGWYTDETFETPWNFDTDVVNTAKFLFGKWEFQKYTITYIRNDGEWVTGFDPTVERLYGTAVTLPTNADITKYGYTLAGWFENSDFTGPISEIVGNFADNKTVYASWTRLDTTKIITFYDNYSGATAEQAFTLGDDTAIRTDVFTRSGYTFIRWKDISGNVYLNTNQLTGDIALFAEWQQNPTPAPTPTPSRRNNNGRSSENSSGRSVGGPIPQNQLQQPVQMQTGAAPAPQKAVPTYKNDQIVVNGLTTQWQYDPVNNSWKLSALDLMGAPTVAANGFYILNQTTVVMENNNLVPKTVQETYYFDETGNMVTGWVKTGDNKWYFFNNEKTLDEGKLCIGWKQIDGAWYFFSSNDGSMMTNTTTSDGYRVGADGRWVQ